MNEDNNDDVTLLRQKVKRLHQELALARALAAKATAGLRVSDNSGSVTAREAAQQAAHEAAAELQELQEQLEHALQLISDLECRNSELEQAREFWLRCAELIPIRPVPCYGIPAAGECRRLHAWCCWFAETGTAHVC